MRMSPIAIALSIALMATTAAADSGDSFDQQIGEIAATVEQAVPVFQPDELNDYDKAFTSQRRSAIVGAIHDDEELQELRALLTKSEEQRRRDMEREKLLPMEPDEIKDLRRAINEVERAQNEPITGVNFRIRNVTYNPDSNQPLVIMVADGYAAQVEFYDASGQPWSIRRDGVVGDADSFSRKVMGEQRHISSFSLSSRYRQSNAAVVLEGMPTTIPVLLKGSDSVVDGRVSVTIPKLGPNASVLPVFSHEMDNVSSDLVSLQGGVAPAGAKRLRVSGVSGAEAWYDGEFLYLGLPGRLLNPPPINGLISPTGRHLYKISPATYFTVSVNGERLVATVEDLYQTDIRRQKTVFDKGTH